MTEYEKEYEKFAKILDRYNLGDTLSSCYASGNRDAFNIRWKVCELYPELEEALDGLTLDEFMGYLTKKYPVYFEEVTIFEMHLKR